MNQLRTSSRKVAIQYIGLLVVYEKYRPTLLLPDDTR